MSNSRTDSLNRDVRAVDAAPSRDRLCGLILGNDDPPANTPFFKYETRTSRHSGTAAANESLVGHTNLAAPPLSDYNANDLQ